MKSYILFLLILLLAPILCQAASAASFLNYSHEFYSDTDYALDRVNFGGSGIIYKGLLGEQTSINLTRIAKDPWNDFKDNYSVASLASGLISYFMNTSYGDSTSETLKMAILAIPVLTNSMVYYPIIKSNSTSMKSISIAPFIKNDTDVFMFRTATWGQFTPGVGLRVYFGNSNSESGIAVGIERSLQTDFTAKTRTKDLYFLRAGINWAAKPKK